MEESEQFKSDNYVLYYQGTDDITKIRILGDGLLSNEYSDDGETRCFSTTLRIHKLSGSVTSSIDIHWQKTITLQIDKNYCLDIVPTGILHSWQNYFNSSTTHHWKNLCNIIDDCMSKELMIFNLNLQEHLINLDPNYVSAVITLEDFSLSGQFIGEYYQLYYTTNDGSVWWRFLSKSCITEAQLLPDFKYRVGDIYNEWLNVIKTDSSKKTKLQIKNPFLGKCQWDDIFYNMNSGRCLSLFTEIENYFNDPELNKVVHIGKD